MAKISVKNLFKVFGPNPEHALQLASKGRSREDILRQTRSTVALRDVSLNIAERELLVVRGFPAAASPHCCAVSTDSSCPRLVPCW